MSEDTNDPSGLERDGYPGRDPEVTIEAASWKTWRGAMNRGATRKPLLSRRRVDLYAVLAVLALMLPAPVAADEVDARLDRLREFLRSCTEKHGYDPKKTAALDDHDIAPGEKSWRRCAYDGIRKIMIPRSAVPGDYQNLIASDQTMTREIGEGKLTRDEREARIKKLVDAALAREEAAASGSVDPPDGGTGEDELLKQRNELVARQREIQKMRRIQSMMR